MSIYLDKLQRTAKELTRYTHTASSFAAQQQHQQALEHYVWADVLIEHAILLCEAGIENDAENADIFRSLIVVFDSIHQAAEIAIFKATLDLRASELGETN